jgi:hypothetical protein
MEVLAKEGRMARITIEREAANAAAEEHYRRLETGDILFFPQTPFHLTDDERAFLLSQKQVNASYHKNISYRPAEDRLKGVDQKDEAQWARMHQVMRSYSERAIAFMGSFLSRYARDWKIDFASFRPIEEEGRKVSLRSRNDLIHVDSFPSRPSHGDRLLRVFTNIHPERARIWVTSDSFEQLAWQYAGKARLPHPPTPLTKFRSQALRLLSGIGLPVVDRPPYDQFMLRFHHYLKESETFQRECPKDRWEFVYQRAIRPRADVHREARKSCVPGEGADLDPRADGRLPARLAEGQERLTQAASSRRSSWASITGQTRSGVSSAKHSSRSHRVR